MKQIKHTFGNEERTLSFGVMYFYKFIGEFNGGNPFIISDIRNPAVLFKYVTGLVYAGINAYNKLNNLPAFSIQEAEDLVGVLSDDEASVFINKYTDLVKTGEVQAQA